MLCTIDKALLLSTGTCVSTLASKILCRALQSGTVGLVLVDPVSSSQCLWPTDGSSPHGLVIVNLSANSIFECWPWSRAGLTLVNHDSTPPLARRVWRPNNALELIQPVAVHVAPSQPIRLQFHAHDIRTGSFPVLELTGRLHRSTNFLRGQNAKQCSWVVQKL